MDWLSNIGTIFGALTNPVDLLMSWIVTLAMEAINWALGSVVKIMKLSDTFYEVKLTRDFFSIVEYACYLIVGAVAVYYVFSVLLDMATGGSGESPQKVIGKFLNYGFRILSMPFFLFTFIHLNSKFIDVISEYGINPKGFIKDMSTDASDSANFIKRMVSMMGISNGSVLLPALFGLGMAILFFVLLAQLVRRTGDLFFLYILIPPVAVTIFTKDLDMYSSWTRQLISVIGGQSVQVIGIFAGIGMILGGHGIIGNGILLSTISTPAVIKEFAYTAKKSGGGVSQIASSGLMMLAK